ncbi:MAG TPA: DoxX family protein [Vicinamibacterales bacterium]|nr:DoxX family protein [Vicinamibacterales bacterium]
MFETERGRIPSRIDALVTWLPRIAVAVFFVTVGSSKFRDPMWVRLFERIGLGQWFRVLTGVLQISAGLLALLPRTALLGVAIAACTMVGAVTVWLTVLNTPFTAVIPGVLLLVLVAIGQAEFNREAKSHR